MADSDKVAFLISFSPVIFIMVVIMPVMFYYGMKTILEIPNPHMIKRRNNMDDEYLSMPLKERLSYSRACSEQGPCSDRLQALKEIERLESIIEYLKMENEGLRLLIEAKKILRGK